MKYGKARARKERKKWYRHLLSWFIGGGILGSMILYMNHYSQTEALVQILFLWSFILVIDFVVSFSYTLFPKKS
ncbi:2TM domain-containing protein [Gracilibacillus timonensis]|uniref:2TM domain-containing protein n=1 Tax=Gracilibacillus timonensis TaxID=1816696 RepID=UPI0011DCE6F9